MQVRLPVAEAVYCVDLSPDSLAFTSARKAGVYGTGRIYAAWHDQPSYETLRSTLRLGSLYIPEEVGPTLSQS